jgi:hypothetical protein
MQEVRVAVRWLSCPRPGLDARERGLINEKHLETGLRRGHQRIPVADRSVTEALNLVWKRSGGTVWQQQSSMR